MFLLLFQRDVDQNCLPVPAVGGDGLPTYNALYLPPDCGGSSWQLWSAEPGAQYQLDLYRAAGEKIQQTTLVHFLPSSLL